MNRQQLVDNIRRKGSFLCVGLDTDPLRLPEHLREDPDGVMKFNRAIIDATAPYCVAFKPNAAFYESRGARGFEELRLTIEYIRRRYPDQFVILDAKRGDIGNTSRMYARSAFEHLDADAVTVAPYMGRDSVDPFLGYEGRWVVLLALTSNPGSADFQMMVDAADGRRLFEHVITTSQQWATADEMMYVVGATKAPMLADIRRLAPRSFLLVPGVGAQGGSLQEVAQYGMTDDCGLLVNSSRGIIYASSGEDFAEAAAREASRLATEMKHLLESKQ